MMSNNKILTVSYGTFSCTLEGFDDSFGTMKAIAEYFRDLAADDRYFGAEPPVPDAEMLARIAEREISRRVEAREHEGKIVLRADDAQDPQGVPAAAPVAAAAALIAADAVAEAEEAPIEEAPSPEIASEPEEATSAEMPADQHDVEADADDAAIVQSPAADQDDAEQIDETPTDTHVEALPEETDAGEDVDASQADTTSDAEQDPIEDAVTASETDTFVEDENDIVPGQRDSEVEAFFAEAKEETPVVVAEEIEPVIDTSASNSIAAKLQRIRAVVSQHEDTAPSDYAEDQHAQVASEAPAASEDNVADALRDITSALAADDEVEAQRETPESEAAEEDLTEEPVDAGPVAEAEDRPAGLDAATDDSLLAGISETLKAEEASEALADVDDAMDDIVEQDHAPEPQAEEVEEVQAAELPAPAEEDEDDVSAILARIASKDRDTLISDVEEAELADSAENLFDETPVAEDAAEETPAVDKTPVTVSSGLELEVAPQPDKPRARVIKVKRADFEAAIADGNLEEYEDDEADAPEATAPIQNPASSLSPEDEAELARELAELEADLNADPAPEEEDDDAQAVLATLAAARREDRPAMEETAEADMNRLMAEADTKMEEPESATRRDAFAHLKAAVAAKKADQALGGDTAETGQADAYRDDLAEVVKPRRPSASGSRTQRPGAEPRPAPLKLVAEQRIDTPRAPAGPVRPRRVAAVADPSPTTESGTSFAEFADEMGATELGDLLEAAAAYMSFVEKRDQFSRPQLMTKVRQVKQDSFNREDGLRSFGQLLRAGKIEKIKGGRFTVSDQIGFKPDQRAVG